jgi:hypothetical protein
MPQEPTAGALDVGLRGHAATDVYLRRTARLWWGFPEGIDLARRRWAQGAHRTLMRGYQTGNAVPRDRHVKGVIRALTGV